MIIHIFSRFFYHVQLRQQVIQVIPTTHTHSQKTLPVEERHPIKPLFCCNISPWNIKYLAPNMALLQNYTLFCHSLFNSLQHNPYFYWPMERSLLKTLWEKENMVVTSIFLFSHNVFYLSQKIFYFSVNLICRLQMSSIWTSLSFCHLARS